MTPKEKAKYIYFKYYGKITLSKSKAKQCALLAVDEILKLESNNGYYFDGTNVTSISYWQEVKQEIDKL